MAYADAHKKSVDNDFEPDVHSVESRFFYDLLEHVFRAYDMSVVLHELYCFRSEVESPKKNTHTPQEIRDHKRLVKKKGFCLHIGNAILAISHHYRPYYKPRFDVMFDTFEVGFYFSRWCMYHFIEELFQGVKHSVAMANAFLVMCSMFTELTVYMVFRGDFSAIYFVWCFFEVFFRAAFEEEFDRCGGWKLIKQAARPWWKILEQCKDNIDISKPEYIYYIQANQNIPDMVLYEVYVDEEDPSDKPCDPPNFRDKVNNIAFGNRGCHYYCEQKAIFDKSLLAESEEFSTQLFTVLDRRRQEIANKAGPSLYSENYKYNPGTATVRPSLSGFAARVAPLTCYRPEYRVPKDYIPHNALKKKYREHIGRIGINTNVIALFDELYPEASESGAEKN